MHTNYSDPSHKSPSHRHSDDSMVSSIESQTMVALNCFHFNFLPKKSQELADNY